MIPSGQYWKADQVLNLILIPVSLYLYICILIYFCVDSEYKEQAAYSCSVNWSNLQAQDAISYHMKNYLHGKVLILFS